MRGSEADRGVSLQVEARGDRPGERDGVLPGGPGGDLQAPPHQGGPPPAHPGPAGLGAGAEEEVPQTSGSEGSTVGPHLLIYFMLNTDVMSFPLRHLTHIIGPG